MRFALLTALGGGHALALQELTISQWHLQSTEVVGSNDLAALSEPGYDSSSWHTIPARSTVFGGLLEAGVYDADHLFYSTNLQDTVDYRPYYSPWLYRSDIPVKAQHGKHYHLQTNGITSKADIWLNGRQVANKSFQAGAYGGHTYDVTDLLESEGGNALLIRAWPTDYNRDFALGFVDWNPYPPDNGTGVWRDVSVKETGPLMLGPVRVVHDWTPESGKLGVKVTIKVDVTNFEDREVTGWLDAAIDDEAAYRVGSEQKVSTVVHLAAHQTRTISLSATIENAKIWWPAQWGSQPLYTAHVSLTAGKHLSDQASSTTFGIRHVTSHVNAHNDTLFTLNGHPFQVRGAGYAPDIFLRWDITKFRTQAQYVLDMGLNTIRLEGKMEHPELYAVADEMGLMVMAGWECCDKWEAWPYNEDVTDAPLWNGNDYATAGASIRHEGGAMQSHPSMLAFLVGSDYWPDDRATEIYVDALRNLGWQVPVIASAAKRGYPDALGPSGLKMDGPYDWVPPNYWYDRQQRLGSAGGFGSELGAGVGTPELKSLKKFLSEDDLKDLWTKPNKGLYHMSTNVSQFYDRSIYNGALWQRYGEPASLEDYLLKAQIMDYEATRAEFEAYSAKWNAARPATGVIYWMLNNAWPSLHWNLFDYYLHPGGSYFGAKVGNRPEHVAYDYEGKEVWLINHSTDRSGSRKIEIELIDLGGKVLRKSRKSVDTVPNTSESIGKIAEISKIKDVAFLRLLLSTEDGAVLSRNIYWLTSSLDRLDWDDSTWYHTPVSRYADLTALQNLKTAKAVATFTATGAHGAKVVLESESDIPAFFIRLNLVDGNGDDVVPVMWSDNYVTLFPREKRELEVSWRADCDAVAVELSGSNVGPSRSVRLL